MCLHLSFLNLYHLISTVNVILFGLDCLSILLYSYVHIPHINCLIISLNWYFVNWGSKRSRAFYTHFELSTMIILKSKSNVTNTNYFTTFLQTADMALIFSK